MTESALGVGLELASDPESPGRIGAAILRFFEGIGTVPHKMTYRNPKAKTRAFRRASFEALLEDEQVLEVTLWTEGQSTVVTCFLRFVPNPAVPLAVEFVRRWFGLCAASAET